MKKRFRSLRSLISVSFLLAGLAALAGCGGGGGSTPPPTPAAPGDLVWAVTSNPTGSGAEALSMAVDSGSLYAVGYDTDTIQGDDEWRIESRSLANGSSTGFSLVTSNPTGTTINSFDDAYGVVTDGTGTVYVVGSDSAGTGGSQQWRIEKRSLTSGALNGSFGNGGVIQSANTGTDNVALAVAKDATSLYVVGYDYNSSGNEEWRIEKRNLSDGALVSGFTGSGVVTSATGTGLNEAMAITVDSTYMYVVGFDTNASGNEEWRIEKRNLSDGALTSFGTNSNGIVTSATGTGAGGNEASAIAVDSTYMYVVGYDTQLGDAQWRIEKRKLSDGSLDTTFGTNGVVTFNPSLGDDKATAVAVDGTYMYVAGNDSGTVNSYYEWRIEKRKLSDGSLDTTFGTNGVVTVNPNPGSDAVPWSIGLDSTGIYIAGYDTSASGVREWRIEKRKK